MKETKQAPRVLYVDDDRRSGSVFERQMRGFGFSVTVTNSGFQALRILESSPFDVVVSDLRMPRMDGHALLSEIRAAHITSNGLLSRIRSAWKPLLVTVT
ncbi:MAG: response regulator, partial [Myxococcota bacterium]